MPPFETVPPNVSLFGVSHCSFPFRHRSGFTSKTLPHVHQPYVVKVSPTPRHVLRRAATRDLAIPCISYRCCASRSDSTPLNRPPVTNKPAPHLGQPYVVKPGFLPRSETFRYAQCRIATHSLSVYEQDRPSSRAALRGEAWAITGHRLSMCRSAAKRDATYSLVEPCSVPFRHRSGFTSKTLTHHQQPYVVKLVPNSALLCASALCCAPHFYAACCVAIALDLR